MSRPVAAFMKQKDRHAEETKLASVAAQPVYLFLHRIADKDQRVDLAAARLADRMGQHAFDLGLATDAKHAAHDPVQIGRGRHPTACLALRKAAVIDELDLKTSDRPGSLEHLAL